MSLSSKIPTVNRRAPMRVLVVDQDQASRRVTEGTINRWGYAAYGAESVEKGAQVFDVWAPRFLVISGLAIARTLLEIVDARSTDPRVAVILVLNEGELPIEHPRVAATFHKPVPFHELLPVLSQPPTRAAGS